MARTAQRKVNRSASRDTIVRRYGDKSWYDLPDWAVIALGNNVWRVALVIAFFLAPAALLGTILGAHALPLQFFGIPATDNGVGLSALFIVANFVFVALSVRPLKHFERKGWLYLAIATILHVVNSIILQHAVTAFVLLAVVAYGYFQVRHRFVA